VKIDKKQKNDFKDNGYLVIKKLINKKLIKKLQKTIIDRSKQYLNSPKNFKNFYDKSFHSSLINLKKKNPASFAFFYIKSQIC